jgi:mRNA-degrading endonuclease RelE of RelBE toxin-antitoxin system
MGSYSVKATDQFLKKFRKLSKAVQEQLNSKITELAEDPLRFRPLRHDYRRCRRLRVGVMRVIFEVRENIVYLLDVSPRRIAYKSGGAIRIFEKLRRKK